MTPTIAELHDDSAIAAFLASQRLWTAYGLCDLDPAYRHHATYLGALYDGRIVATVLVYASPAFTGILPFGGQEGVATILTTSRELPTRTFLLLGEEHVHAVERRYRLSESWSMRRMAVDADRFSPSASIEPVVRLSAEDRPAMEELYGTERNSVFFDDETINHGVYFGVYDGVALVAIAGTHAWSKQHRIGAVGGVFTRPDRRGLGLAQATTGAVTQGLLELGVDDVVLNVRADNEPALRCYTRLGFRPVRSYLEGNAVDRRSGTAQMESEGR